MSLSNDVAVIELLSKTRMAKVTTNQNIDYIVFYPKVNHMLIRKDGKWVKVEYKLVEP